MKRIDIPYYEADRPRSEDPETDIRYKSRAFLKTRVVVHKVLIEIYVSRMLSTLVRTNACPGFPMEYGNCAQITKLPLAIEMFMEIGYDSLVAWALKRQSKENWMSVTFQVFAALMWMGRYYDIVHNDLYFRNIVYNAISPRRTVYRYVIDTPKMGRFVYDVKTNGLVAKILDYGVVSSDALFDKIGTVKHQDITFKDTQYADLPLSANLMIQISGSNQGQHILYYPAINPYARDIGVYLSLLITLPTVPATVRYWACLSLQFLYEKLFRSRAAVAAEEQTEEAFLNVEDLVQFVVEIFDPFFLASVGMDPEIFGTTTQSDQPKQLFVLPVLSENQPTEISATVQGPQDSISCDTFIPFISL
jgi:hypothetical protein